MLTGAPMISGDNMLPRMLPRPQRHMLPRMLPRPQRHMLLRMLPRLPRLLRHRRWCMERGMELAVAQRTLALVLVQELGPGLGQRPEHRPSAHESESEERTGCWAPELGLGLAQAAEHSG